MSEFSISQPWDDLREAFLAALTTTNNNDNNNNDNNNDNSSDNNNFVSAFCPCLPPLMTEERRIECRKWKQLAILAEERLAKNRLQRIQQQQALDVSEHYFQDRQEMQHVQEQHEEVFQRVQDVQNGQGLIDLQHGQDVQHFAHVGDLADEEDGDRFVLYERPCSSRAMIVDLSEHEEQEDDLIGANSAFKNLIHKLRASVKTASIEVAYNDEVDNDNDANDDDLESPPSPMEKHRKRSNSYTLDEPSPLLRAYMDRYGDADMSFGSARTPSKAKPNREENLDSFLADVSAMPNGTTSPTKVIKANQASEISDDESKDLTSAETITVKSVEKPEEITKDKHESEQITKEDILVSLEAKDLVSEVLEEKVENEEEISDDESRNSAAMSTVLPSMTSDISITEAEAEKASSSDSVTTTVAAKSNNQFNTNRIEEAVSTLARSQKVQVHALLESQARQRQELQQMFEQQQQELLSKIKGSLEQRQTESARTSALDSARTLTSASTMPKTETEESRMSSATIPTLTSHRTTPTLTSYRADTMTSAYLESGRTTVASPTIPTLTSATPILLPDDYQLPVKALQPEMHSNFCRLSALVKGHLVRKLLQTSKVQSMLTSMKDTMSTALDLHREERIRPEDVELHRRLLQQLNRDSQSVHDVFFKLHIRERMALIKADRERHMREQMRSEKQGRRISAATVARLEAKQRMLRLQTESPKLGLVVNKRRKMIANSPRNFMKKSSPNARRSLYGSNERKSSSPQKPPRKPRQPWK